MSNHHDDDDLSTSGARLRVPRSRGAVSGLLLLLLGAWGALIPLLGPIAHFGYTPNKAWHLSAGRFWLEILPGAVAVAGGLLLLLAANRVVTSLGAWLGVAAGAWFIVAPTLRTVLHLGSTGVPIASSSWGKAITTLLLFYGIGALILFLAAQALGRLGVISVRDVRAARRRDARDDDNDDRHVDEAPEPRRTEQVTTRVEPAPVVPTTPVRTTVIETDDTTDTSGPSHDDRRGKGSGSTRL